MCHRTELFNESDKMPIEIEVKIPINDFNKLFQQLQDQGFRHTKVYEEEDTYFNSIHYDLRRNDKALRIRRTVDIGTGRSWAELNCKGPKLDHISMSRKELEIPIENPDVIEEILSEIAFFPVDSRVKKRRYYFTRDRIVASLDRVKGLGDFLELEIMELGEDKREEGLTELEKVIIDIGYTMKDTVRVSYLSMLQE